MMKYSLTVKDVYKQLGISKGTLYKYMKDHKIYSKKLEGKRKFSQEDVDHFGMCGEYKLGEEVSTSYGTGRLLEYDKQRGIIVLEMDNQYAVKFNESEGLE